MSLIKLLKIPSRLFKKDVITFFIIRRQDLGIIDDKLRYIAVRPAASISRLRQKVWHVLELPDYCEEIIILKNEDGKELPLTHLRKGNDPQHPFILEVYLPEKQTIHLATKITILMKGASLYNNMITMYDKSGKDANASSNGTFEINHDYTENTEKENTNNENRNKLLQNLKTMETDYKKSELSCKLSASSIFFKIHGRKSRDNFANILLKIQSDLKTLNNKLSDLETRIQV